MQGIAHAEEYVQTMEKATQAEAASTSKSAAKLLKNFFRKASAKSVAMGMARIKMEEAVERAERILLEKKRQQIAMVASKEEQAEVIADELYHKPGTILGEKELAHIYQLTQCEELRPDPNCAETAFYHSLRSITGVCNNLEHPTQGASFTPFQRILPPRYADGLRSLFDQSQEPDLGPFLPPFPSARIVSDTAITDREINDTILTHLIMQWGQFMDHDLVLAVEFPGVECDLDTCAQTPICAPIRVPSDDSEFGENTANMGRCHAFQRTVPACQENPTSFEPREQVNELTHYIDGSMVYGSTEARALFLREGQGGRLRESANDNLPTQPPCAPFENPLGEVTPGGTDCCPPGFDDCFVGGDVRVLEHVSLTVMHTVFVREHNRIAAALSQVNPQWEDERLYIETRDIVIAEIQHITFDEYLPALFGDVNFARYIGQYPGYNPEIDASIPNSFATAAYRFGHSQIQPTFARLDSNLQPVSAGPLNLRDSFFNPTEFFNGGGVSPIVQGWVVQPARALDEFLNSVITSQLFVSAAGIGLDLASLNIQRGRDHGLPGYATFKRFCASAIGQQSDFRNQLTALRLTKLYKSEEDIDLFVGALAEEPLIGSPLGSILTCIFALTFTRLRAGDRFWYENPDPSLDIFTPDQLTQIKRTSLARILCDNGGLQSVQAQPFFLDVLSFDTVGCNTIPGIDFMPFQEVPFCFYRASVTTAAPTLFRFINRRIGTGNTDLRSFQWEATPGTQSMCIPFVCPGTGPQGVQDIIISVPPGRRFACRTVQTGSVTFRTGISAQDLDTDPRVFETASDCEASSVSLADYVCDGLPAPTSQEKIASTAELENELAKALQNGNGGMTGRLPPIKLEKTTNLDENMYSADDLELLNDTGPPPVSPVFIQITSKG